MEYGMMFTVFTMILLCLKIANPQLFEVVTRRQQEYFNKQLEKSARYDFLSKYMIFCYRFLSELRTCAELSFITVIAILITLCHIFAPDRQNSELYYYVMFLYNLVLDS